MDLKARILERLDFENFYRQELPGLTNGRGDEGKALCPFHEDTEPSLSVNLKSGKFLCFGCGEKGDIFTFYQKRHDCDFKGALTGLARIAGVEGPPRTKPKEQSKAKIVTTYDYHNAQGEMIFQVCRMEPKSFRQRRPDGKGGWIWDLKGVDSVPYRLPELIEAETVFIPEGEKDCDNLRDQGLNATCNPMGAGKWRDDYAPYFKGKQVVILPDNDPPGKAHAQHIARSLHGIAASVKIVELPGLPEKGDVSDWLKAGGTKEQLLALAETAPEYEPTINPLAGTPYLIDGGRLCFLKQVGSGGNVAQVVTPLCNFVAQCDEELIKDDGRETTREFIITGNLDTGQDLSKSIVKAHEFRGMGWINKCWGMAANITAGQSAQDRVREAIQHLSRTARQRVVFTHSGWRKINGIWAFLHGEGAINGPEGIEVDLGPDLRRYCLPAPGGPEAAQASFALLNIAPPEITYPFIACTYLAPLADLLKVNFTLWPIGPTGSLKSTMSALFLSHFGDFTELTLPGQWSSTANALERRAFILKDLPFIIDDYAPQLDHRRANEMEAKAHRIIRAAGNRGGRQRLTGDMTERQTYDPRCLIISTGELTPSGQSLAARYFTVEMHQDKINLEKLSAAQRIKALYPQAMSAYLHWLAPRLDDTLEMSRELWEGYRNAAQTGAHLRVPEMIAWLALGFDLFLKFQREMGSLGDTYDLENEAWEVFTKLAQAHGRLIEGEKPTLKFLNVLRELFIQKRVYLQGIDGNCPQDWESLGWQAYDEPAPNGEFIGWADNDYLYLMPETTFKAIQRTIREQGGFLGVGKNELFKNLSREGFIEPDKNGENTRVKEICGRSRRVIFMAQNGLLG